MLYGPTVAERSALFEVGVGERDVKEGTTKKTRTSESGQVYGTRDFSRGERRARDLLDKTATSPVRRRRLIINNGRVAVARRRNPIET